MYQMSGVFGNTFSYFWFRDSHEIDDRTRNVFVGTLLCVSLAGTAVFLLLRPMPWAREARSAYPAPDTPATALKRAWALFATREMLILTPFFVYMGLAYAFWTGVYGPCLSFTLSFGEESSNGLTGLHGILVHCGCVSGGLLFAFLGRGVTRRLGRSPVILLGMAANFGGYALALMNLPDGAAQGPTDDPAAVFDPSSLAAALAASFLLGAGEGTISTQVKNSQKMRLQF